MILTASSLSKNFASQEILTNVNLSIHRKDKIGLIGGNGTGKTTLLKLLTGELEADGGTVSSKSGTQIGFLKQDLGLDPEASVIEEGTKPFLPLIEEEQIIENLRTQMETEKNISTIEKISANYHKRLEQFTQNRGFYFRGLIESTLKGLGFTDSDLQRKIKSLSGGQKMRVALAKMLLTEPDIVFLDEPTNYLDFSSIQWLENTLSQYPKAYVVVSHDRYFLEKTVTTIWETENHGVHTYRGNYSAYIKQKQLLRQTQKKAYDNQQNYIKKQQQVIDKLKSFNREKSVRRAESREKMLDKIEKIDKPIETKTSNITFNSSEIISKTALTLTNLCVGYNKKAVLKDINIQVRTGEKIGICGNNATGKSTILKTIIGQIPPVCGKVELGRGIEPTYFKQEHEDLNPANSILTELAEYSGEDNLTVRKVLANLLFFGDDVYKEIRVLSGGERSRVAVAKLMLTKSNMLLLDEPTNHLDIPSKEVFEQAMQNYTGTLLVVSHDRYLLNHIADRILFAEDGICYSYDASYEKAMQIHENTVHKTIQEHSDKPKKNERETSSSTLSKNMRKRYETRICEIEERWNAIEQEKKELELAMQGETFANDIGYAVHITETYDNLVKEYEESEDEWLTLTEILEENR